MVDKDQPKQYEYRIGPVSAILPYGSTIEVELTGKRSNALLDTGAAYSGIDIRMARELGLVEAGSRQVIGVTGRGSYPTFSANLFVPRLDYTLPGPLIGIPLKSNGIPVDAVVGRDIICRYEFTINASTGLIRFAEL